jgi:hypothetical protein
MLTPLLDLDQETANSQSQLSKEEKLILERKRAIANGITTFKYIAANDSMIFSSGSSLYSVPGATSVPNQVVERWNA